MKTLKKHSAYIIFLILIIGLIVATYRDYGITWDEFYYLNIGKNYIFKALSFFHIKTNLTAWEFPLMNEHLKGHGVLFDVAAAALMVFFSKLRMENYHLIKALMAVPVFILIGLIVEKMTKNRWLSLIAMMLLLLFPRFYGDIFNNNADIQTTLAVTLVIGCFVFSLDGKRSIRQQILLGLVLAVAVSQRFFLIYLVAIEMGGLWVMGDMRVMKKIKENLSVIASFSLFVHIIHPYLFKHPVTGLFEALTSSNKFPWTGTVLFEGVYYEAGKLPLYYLYKMMLITIPLSIIILFAIGNITMIADFFKKKNAYKKTVYLYLLAVFYTPFILIIIFRPVVYDAWRQFLFLTVPIIIIAIFGLQSVIKMKNTVLKITLSLLILFNLGQTIGEMIVLHPYQYIYFNRLVGGLSGANGQYETEYWGAAYKEAVEWFNKNINKKDKKYLIRNAGYKESTESYFQKNMFSTDDAAGADYCIMMTRWDAYKTNCQGESIYAVKRMGVPLVYIIKNNKVESP